MKVKYIAAACAALCSVSAFAVNTNVYDATATTPVQTLYIAGASAQKNALLLAVPGTVFDTTTHGVLYIAGPNGSVGWLGDAKSAYGSGITLVIYNSTNGSAAGLNQLISAGSPETEANVLALPATTCGTVGNAAAGNSADQQVACSAGSAVREADMALSDVYSNEFAPNLLSTGSTVKTAASTPSTGVEGFGVIVNSVLYDALLAQNVAEGLLPATCAGATVSSLQVGVGSSVTGNGDCQPSVRSTDYGSLVTSAGRYNSYLAVAPGQANLPITVCRRDNLSGTQAASNIFFLNNVCGLKGYAGALSVSTAADSSASYIVVDQTNDGTGKAEVCVWSGSAAGATANANYGIGVVSLGEKDAVDAANAKPFYFVKLDGISPNFKADGSYDSTHRTNLANGSYKFATEMAAYVKTATVLTTGVGKVAKAIADDIAKASLSNLTGIAYLTGGTAGDGKMSRYKKSGNNCAAWK